MITGGECVPWGDDSPIVDGKKESHLQALQPCQVALTHARMKKVAKNCTRKKSLASNDALTLIPHQTRVMLLALLPVHGAAANVA